MEDGKPDETDTGGKKDNPDTPKPEEPDKKPVSATTSIEEAREINKETKELLDRREKIIKREEDLHAVKMVGGHTVAGQETPKTPEEIKETEASDRVNRIGKAMGAEWANKKEE